MKYHSISEIGQKRKNNQDNFTIIKENQIFVVADGMGGHQGGETASRIAVEEVENFYKIGDTLDITKTDIEMDLDTQRLKNLKQAIRQASRTIYSSSRIDSKKAGMGTTIVVLQIVDEKAFVAHVGDSRVYKLNGKNIRQITKDHSRIQELIDTQQITPEEVENYPFKNVITRALGSGSDIEVDTSLFPYSPEDAFLLCTDGICGVLKDDEISAPIFKYPQHPELALKEMGELVEKAGSPDNYTAILIVGDKFGTNEEEFLEDTGPVDLNDIIESKLPNSKKKIKANIFTEKNTPANDDINTSEITIPDNKKIAKEVSFDNENQENDEIQENDSETMKSKEVSEKKIDDFTEDDFTVDQPEEDDYYNDNEEVDQIETPLPSLKGFKLYDENDKQEITQDLTSKDKTTKRKLFSQKKKQPKPIENEDILTDKENTAQFRIKKNSSIEKIHSPQRKPKKKKTIEPNTKKYIILICLLLIFYLTLCVINNFTYWIQYDGEMNTLEIMRGNFHPFNKEVIYSIEVVKKELWMMMIQDNKIKRDLNQGKSFFRIEDLNTFIAKIFLDVGQRYITEGGLKEHLVAINLFKRGKEYGLRKKLNKQLVVAEYKVAREYEDKGDYIHALDFYDATNSLSLHFKDTVERIQKIVEQKKAAETKVTE